MRKIAPLLTIITGVTTLLFSLISILAIYNVIENNAWVGKFKLEYTTTTISYSIAIAIAVLQILLGCWSWKKARGFSSLLLIISFAIIVCLLIVAAKKADAWPLSTIFALSIDSFALIGVTLGFIKGN